jgi:hypothetical protein
MSTRATTPVREDYKEVLKQIMADFVTRTPLGHWPKYKNGKPLRPSFLTVPRRRRPGQDFMSVMGILDFKGGHYYGVRLRSQTAARATAQRLAIGKGVGIARHANVVRIYER